MTAGTAENAAVGDRRLGAVVLIAGSGALAVEICASRLLAPFFGSSTIVWANIIGLILLYLAVGYWLGGRLADRRPEVGTLALLLTAAAVCVAALPYAAAPFLGVALHAFGGLSAGVVVASFFATLALFSIPVTLLGMVSPVALRLAVRDVGTAGRVAGRLYALSTMGSIAGTFLPALVTIPLAGTHRTLLGAALLLAAAAALLRPRIAVPVALITVILLALPVAPIKEQPGLIVERESAYQYIDVTQGADGERDLHLNEGVAIHSVWRPTTTLTGGEWDMFLVPPALLDHPVQRVLVIGNAGGTTARQYARYYPQARVDGVEIDPAVTAVGRAYLGENDNPRLVVHDVDGRVFLEETNRTWDVIIVDAYRQPYIPFHLTTQEFFALCRVHLDAGGVLALNVERIPGDDALSGTVESTVASVMPGTWVWHALKFNELVVAINAAAPTRPAVRRPMDPAIAVLGRLFDEQVVAATTSHTPMTDDRAPIEWLTDRALLDYIAGGGRLDERGLPTG